MKKSLVLLFVLLYGCGGLSSQGSSPRLDPLDDQRVVVGEKLSFSVSATDPDGDALIFKISGRPEGAQFVALDDGETAIFSWIPEVTDSEPGGKAHLMEFFVQDAGGLWDNQEIVVTVLPQGGAYFTNPPGYVLDLAEENNIEFVVTVKDDSATQIDITVEQGPDNVYLEQSGKKQAYFYWRPLDEQVAQKLFWYVRFKAVGYAADPNAAGQVTELYTLIHDISIVITNPDYAGCPGNPPTIKHEVLADYHFVTGSGLGYEVVANIIENDSEVGKAQIRWTTTNPGNEEAYQTAPMEQVAGTEFAGHIPKTTAGSGLYVYYFLEVWDNDDYAGNSCDHAARYPKQGYLSFVAYDPGFENTCLQDGHEPNDSFEDAEILMDPGSYGTFRLCPGDEDYFLFTASAPAAIFSVQAFGNGNSLMMQAIDGTGDPVAAVVSGTSSVSIPASKFTGGVLIAHFYSSAEVPISYDFAFTLEQMECSPDEMEGNDTVATAPLLGEGQFSSLSICPGDVDFYRLEIPTGTVVTALVEHAAAEGDLDLYLLAGDGESILSSAATAANDEQIEFNVVSGGSHYLEVKGFAGSANNYNLTIDFGKQADNCQEDSFAPNQYMEDAVMVPPSVYKQLVSCPGKEDWFVIGLNGGENLTIEAAAGSAPGVVLYATDGAKLCNGSAGSGGTTLSCPIPSPGNYKFVIANSGAAAVVYDLTVAVSEDMSYCLEDRFEENDFPEEGALFEGETTTWLKACGTDPDWFHFAGYPMDNVFVGLVFDQGFGFVDVYLYPDGAAQPAAWSSSISGTPFLEYSVPQAGTYHVQVKGNDWDGNVPYNLFLWVN